MKRRTVLIAALIAIALFFMYRRESYRPLSAAHRLGFVDTNPARRVSGPFDLCSPENWEDCKKKA